MITLITVLIGLLLTNALGVLMVAFQLPGTWLMLIATSSVAWWYWDRPDSWGHMGWWVLLTLLILAIIGEIVEFLAGAMGAGKAGASKRAMMCAVLVGFIGAILGTIFLAFIPILGTLIGAAIGSGIGSFLGDMWAGREVKNAFEGGKGAAIGRFWGALGKVIIAGIMWFVVVCGILF
ncbi:DUF456 domain-containing protein [Planctomycetota bacterium]|nr:DUF456 domain-containing protein [Planctomycetota bacterium]